MKFTSILFVLSLFCLISCHKHSSDATDAPTVSITSPVADDQFSNDLVIKMKGEVADLDGLHTMTIKITDDKTKAVLFTESPNVLNSKTYTFNTAWTAKVSDWTDATLSVTAANHAGKETIKMIKIKIWL
jgi:hypothetical protein